MDSNINLQAVYWDNTLREYIYVVAGILIAWLVLQLIKRWILKGVKRLTGRSKTTFDDALLSAAEKFIIPYTYLVINYAIINQLVLSPRVSHVLQIAMTVVTIFFVVRAINHAIHFSVYFYMTKHNEADKRIFQLNGILNVIKVLMWGFGLLFLLDNLGYNVTTIIAGLGIGGIAIALAAQNILGDLFSYFVIFFDKPFEIGDFVVAGAESGTVEQIGIKTSRIRTLGGEELVMPNADLVKTPIHNFKRQEKRRAVFNVRIAYQTDPKVLQQIPGIIKKIVSTKPSVVFDRAHLQNLNDTFINFEVIYNISSADYTLYMDIQQAIYIELLEEFRKRKIALAYPVQNIVIDRTPDDEVKQMDKKNVEEPKPELQSKKEEPEKDII